MSKCKYCDYYEMEGDCDYLWKELVKQSSNIPLLYDGANNAELEYGIDLAKSCDEGWILTSHLCLGSVSSEDLTVKIKYCPMCGRKLEADNGKTD